jgi:hypothetical protein
MNDWANCSEEQRAKNKERCRRFYEKNKDHVKEYSRRWYAENKERSLETKRKYFNSPRGRAVELMNRINKQTKGRRFGKPGFETNLTIEWIEEKIKKGFCETTGIPFDFNDRKGSWAPFSPSVDRIDSKKGYTIDNCRVVCKIYNMAKNQFTDEDVIVMSKALASKNSE